MRWAFLMRAAGLLALAAGAAQGQIQLTLVNNGQNTTLTQGNTYSLGQVLPAKSFTFTVQAKNLGSAPIPCNPALSGTGYSINSPCADSQTNVAPGSVLNIFVSFNASLSGSYSTSFQFDTAGPVFFVITVVPVGLTTATPCSGPGSALTVSFGTIAEGQTEACAMTLTNNSTQGVIVTVQVAGAGFVPSLPSGTQVTLPPGSSSNFTITFEPGSAVAFTGTLTIDSEAFQLSGAAYNPVLPTPVLHLDTNAPQSGQQVTLTMTLPTPSPITVNGSINLAFKPDPSVASIVSDDPTVNFVATGARSVPFSIQQGTTTATLNGQLNAVFATGSTAGKITFTVAANSGVQFSADPSISVTLAPIAMVVDNAAATAIAGALNIQIWGLDNTYSAGQMSFTFLDNTYNAIGNGAVNANFTQNFQGYFSQFASSFGSMFQMLVSFPITGNAAEVGSVNVQLTNSAGVTTQNLVFLNDTGTCVLIGNVLSCPAAPTQ